MAPKKIQFIIENDEQARLIIKYKIIYDLLKIDEPLLLVVKEYLEDIMFKTRYELGLSETQILEIILS